MSVPLQFVSLYDSQEVFVWSDCLLDQSSVKIIPEQSICEPVARTDVIAIGSSSKLKQTR